MSAVGTAILDFGAGQNESFVDVTGQAEITPTSFCEAFFMADDTTSDHTANDHKYAPVFISLTCGTPTAGIGFRIYARSPHKLTKIWQCRWVWTKAP